MSDRVNLRKALLPFGLLVVVISPSLLLFLSPIYEEDAAVCGFRAPGGLQGWAAQGRPLWHFVQAATAGRFRYPDASYVLAAIYTALFAVFFLQLGLLFQICLRCRRIAWFGTTLVGLHFLLMEGRVWSGHFAIAAINLGMLGILLANALTDRSGRMSGIGATAVVAGMSLFALNTHQSGAFVTSSLLAVGYAACLIQERSFYGPLGRRWVHWLAGFLVGVGLYGLELGLIRSTVGLTQRAAYVGGVWHHLQGLCHSVQTSALSPLPWLAHFHPRACGLAFLALFAGLVLLASELPVRARVEKGEKGVLLTCRISIVSGTSFGWVALAALIVVAGSIAAASPNIIWEGYWSSRNLMASMIGIWGGLFLLSSRLSSLRSSKIAHVFVWLLVAVFWVTHIWGFGLITAVKSEDRVWAERLHRDLAQQGASAGDRVEFYARPYYCRFAGWGDLGRSLFATPWGVKAMLMPEIFEAPAIPGGLEDYWSDQKPLPLDLVRHPSRRLATRLSDGRFVVDGGMITVRQMELEYRFTHFWRRDIRYELGDLFALSPVEARGYYASLTGSKDEAIVHPPPPGGVCRVYLRAVEFRRPWTLRARVSSSDERAQNIQIVTGCRSSDGTDREHSVFEMRGGERDKRLRVSGPPTRDHVLWLEARMAPAAENNWWAETRWRRARLILHDGEPEIATEGSKDD